MRTPLLSVVLAALLAGAACRVDRDPDAAAPPGPRADVFADFWFIPGSRVTDTTGTAEAQRRALRVAMPLDTARAVYRDQLRALGWTLVSDRGDTMLVNLHARKDSSLVWISLARGGPGLTNYEVIAARARPDTLGPEMFPVPRR